MLIPSDRHTSADLELWAEYESADMAHKIKEDKINSALTTIWRFWTLHRSRCYVGTSWGKDSTVLCHLASIAADLAPLVWINEQPIASPECPMVRDVYLAKHNQRYHEVVVQLEERNADGEFRATGSFELGIKEIEDTIGDKRILGVRAQESHVRYLTCCRNGMESASSCRPLAWWSEQDIFAYLAKNNLPVHPAYAMLGGGRWPRKHLRIASLRGQRGRQFGRHLWEEEYYPDIVNRLSRR